MAQWVEDRFGFCPEVTARLAKVPGVRWAEVPVAYHPRSHAQGKKIGFRDGLRALYCIGRYTWPRRREAHSGERKEMSGGGCRGRARVHGKGVKLDTFTVSH